jgi:DNA uptake protein ComE-like DNA-binding protein
MREDINQLLKKYNLKTFGFKMIFEAIESDILPTEKLFYIAPTNITIKNNRTFRKSRSPGVLFISDNRVFFRTNQALTEEFTLTDIHTVAASGNGITAGQVSFSTRNEHITFTTSYRPSTLDEVKKNLNNAVTMAKHRNRTVGSAVYFNNNPEHMPINQMPPQKIDLNTCSEQQLTTLPGVGVAIAKRAINIRAQIGGFVSVRDFTQRMGLAPHFAVQVENLAYTAPLSPQIPPRRSPGRVVDI